MKIPTGLTAALLVLAPCGALLAATLATLRDSLLPKLLSGELSVAAAS